MQRRMLAAERLVKRILTGDVVFFVGAGFSFDSEFNSAPRLLLRLIVRFDGLSDGIQGAVQYELERTEKLVRRASEALVVTEENPDASEDEVEEKRGKSEQAQRKHVLAKSRAERMLKDLEYLRANFKDTFKLDSSEWGGGEDFVKRLKAMSSQYYILNEWMCHAFDHLLGHFAALEARLRKRARTLTEQRESRGLEYLSEAARASEALQTVLHPRVGVGFHVGGVEFEQLLNLPSPARGKALFLETMGFADQRVMGGRVYDEAPESVDESLAGRVLPRHEALARLAREGLCPLLLTTNYDLLLEGAYRLAGFGTQRHPSPEAFPPTTLPNFRCITGSGQFSSQGNGHRTAMVVKLHGCVDQYRKCKESTLKQMEEEPRTSDLGGPTDWESYMRSIVFTYREIQNWRDDSWSRDLLRTVLRTRTIALCGYSVADPVMHDTFRTVYEEMSRLNTRLRSHSDQDELLDEGTEGPSSQRPAPAFFLGPAGGEEFHGLEILRAATAATGERQEGLRHRQYLTFEWSEFPNLDETVGWVVHRVMRRIQDAAIQSDLSGVLRQLGLPRHPSTVQRVLKAFQDLRASEYRMAKAWRNDAASRRQFRRMSAWTRSFCPGLVREQAASEIVVRQGAPDLALPNLRRLRWYVPLTDNPSWTAWGVIVELALRNLAKACHHLCAESLSVPEDPCDRISVDESSDHPVVLIWPGQAGPGPPAIAIRYRRFERPRADAAHYQGVQRVVDWRPFESELPWTRTSGIPDDGPSGIETPTAEKLWEWARMDTIDEDRMRADLAKFAGIEPTSSARSTA